MLTRIVVCALLTLGLQLIELDEPLRLIAYLVVYAIIGYDIVWKAVRGISHRQVFDENFLMTVATIGAFFASYL